MMPQARTAPPSAHGTEARERFDEAFVVRLRRKDERAFSELVLAYEARVYRLAWRMLGSAGEAEDLSQEVFVQVWKSIDGFRGDSQLGTWLYRITINLAKNRALYLSRRRRESHSEFETSEALGARELGSGVTVGETKRPDQEVAARELERIVSECLTALDAEHREVLVLRDVENLSYEEVAEITGLVQGTLKSRLHRARALLKSAVEAKLGDKLP